MPVRRTIKPVIKSAGKPVIRKKVAPVLQPIESPVVAMVKQGNIPDTLAETLEAWKQTGNGWQTCLEVDLSLYQKGLQLPSEGKIQINAVRSLVFLGYMLEKKGGLEDCWATRYKLSKIGLKAVGLKETEQEANVVEVLPRERTVAAQKSLETTDDCPECGGIGCDDEGNECIVCDGTGTFEVPSKPIKTKGKEPNGRVVIRTRRK